MDYKMILENMSNYLEEGLIVVNSDLKVVYFTEPSSNITGFKPHEAIGKNIFEVFPNIKPNYSTFHKVIKTGKPIIDHVQHYTNFRGKNVSIVTSTIPIFKGGKINGAVEVFKDLTNVKELSEKILTLQATLHRKVSEKQSFMSNGSQYTIEDIIGNTQPIVQLKSKMKKIANSNSPVFIYGETGTGKELIVQGIHNQSNRRDKPFIAQNCGALPENLLESILFGTVQGSFTGARDKQGLFELADGGTLFLDELNSMNYDLQSKLLRVLEDGIVRRVGGTKTRLVDVRVVAASNIEPKRLVEEKVLREDLYYRLNVLYLSIPPLRDRKEDISLLVSHFINSCNSKMNKDIRGVDKHVMKFLTCHHWPGNVRELQNMIEAAMNFAEGKYITLNDIETCTTSNWNTISIKGAEYQNPKSKSLKVAVAEYEKSLIKKALQENSENCTKAAQALQIPKQTLHGKIRKYEL